MNIEQLVYDMLTESTGIHMMDSGGGSNRGWQRNQKKSLEDFKSEDPVSYSPEDEYHTISVFHYLTSGYLELNDICEDFNSTFEDMEDWDSDIYGVSESAKDYLNLLGFSIGASFNTYNGESSLSQVLQGTYLKHGTDSYVLLQIHNGADVRGGYTDAKLFYLPEDYMPTEDIWGSVERPNGETIEVTSSYNGYSITTEDGREVEIGEGDKVNLYMNEL